GCDGKMSNLPEKPGERTGGENLTVVCAHLPDEEVGLLAGRDYRVTARVQYDYIAEAAFTDSSRWRSGNQLLEVWTEQAWQDLSPQERESWRSRKCGKVTKYGQKFVKQRTAALTTPVVPVMYTDCGISMFRGIESGEKRVPIEITAGVNVNPQSTVATLLDPDRGFRILSASTTCKQGGVKELDKLPLDKDFTKVPGAGWTVPGERVVQTFTREVTVEGEKQSIACSMTAKIQINLEARISDGKYTIPSVGS
ncbi:MAG: hypothetical protein ABEK12_00290, partial [Candidatus Nanohaloarchaea archaeon]